MPFYREIVYLCPFCGSETERVKDKAAGRYHRRCPKCRKLMSKSACVKGTKDVWT